MSIVFYWWFGMDLLTRLIATIVLPLLLTILYIVCRCLKKRWAYRTVFILVLAAFLLTVATAIVCTLETSKPLIAWLDKSPYGSTVCWVDVYACFPAAGALTLLLDFTADHCFGEKKKTA